MTRLMSAADALEVHDKLVDDLRTTLNDVRPNSTTDDDMMLAKDIAHELIRLGWVSDLPVETDDDDDGADREVDDIKSVWYVETADNERHRVMAYGQYEARELVRALDPSLAILRVTLA